MNVRITFLACVYPLLSLASYENAIIQDIDRNFVSIPDLRQLAQIRLVPGSYGTSQLSDTIQRNSISSKNLKEVWLVYTGFSLVEDFDQEKLNRERVRNLEKVLPGIAKSDSVRWMKMRINGIQSMDTARIQYHGFVLVYAIDVGPSLGNVLNRNAHWDSIIVVMDVTTSMLPWLQEATKWLDENYANNRIDRFVYYNDGDGKPDQAKIPGRTGGIHTEQGEDYRTYIKGIKKYLVTGLGNSDIPENTVEALMEAQRYAGPGSIIVLLADNFSTPRDTALIDSLRHPVRVIACGTAVYDINPSLVNIAYRTKGSLHTCFREVHNFGSAKLPVMRPLVFSAGGHQYKTIGRQLKCISCKNDPSLLEPGNLTRR